MLERIGALLNGLPRIAKSLILVVFDASALMAVLWLSYALRLGGTFQPSPAQLVLMALAPAVAVPVFLRLGLYRAVIRYLPERAVWTILRAMFVATLAWVFVLFIAEATRIAMIPRSIPIFYFLLGTVVIAGARFLAKAALGSRRRPQNVRSVLIYGAGESGQQLAGALRAQTGVRVAGFVDDDPGLKGRDVTGMRVHSPERLPELIRNLGVNEIVLTLPEIDAARRRTVVASLSALPVKLRILPAIGEIASGRYAVSRLREIDIDDLLGRSSVPAVPDLIRPMIEKRTILVTGAGGSIGSELCRIVAGWAPQRLVLLEANEFALYEIERSLSRSVDFELVPVLGSVTDRALVERTLRAHRIDAIFHAAAHKHVPLVELNPLEGIRNNVFGTLSVAEAALECDVRDFVLISTDKAVRPTNVMGATKRWAELIVQHIGARAAEKGSGQRFSAVRFGNVLGSAGSVVPLFREQIAAGGPVTLTDEKMTRYFMSIHEAAELIVQAGTLSVGGELFLLDMGQPVRIRELAENMIRLAGLTVNGPETPDGEIAIEVTGIRKGEKLHEELFYDPSRATRTRHPKILMATLGRGDIADLPPALDRLAAALAGADETAARAILFDVVAEGETMRIPATLEVG